MIPISGLSFWLYLILCFAFEQTGAGLMIFGGHIYPCWCCRLVL